MELLDGCIVLLMRSLLSLWWSKVGTTLRLETQRVNTFNPATMDTGPEDRNPRLRVIGLSWFGKKRERSGISLSMAV
jgi:hypothetical protein